MSISNELYAAAERTFYAAGAKPKDVAAILTRLASDFQVTASVDGGLLSMTQGGAPVSVGTIIASYRQKFPRDFYGESGSEVRFKDDLAGDNAAKARFIKEKGYEAWASLPLNEKSAGAQHVTTNAIPNAAMKRADYMRLTVAEKTKLAAELGPAGIGRIMARK